jgi:hypothetical protein
MELLMTISATKYRRILGGLAAALPMMAWHGAPPDRTNHSAAPTRASSPTADAITRVQMQNVDFYVDRDIPLRIRHLRGTMRSKTGGPVVFDDRKSFVIRLDDAEVGLTGRDLSLLMNRYVFNFRGSPLKRLTISTSGNQIVQKGILHKVLDMPFEITATLSVTDDGKIRIHPTRTRILGMGVNRLMTGIGLQLDQIIDLKKANGASVRGNDIFLDPAKILPPPTIEGRLADIRVEGDQVVQRFGSPVSGMPVPDATAANYMFYRGGSIRFGKLLMSDSELQIVDLDPSDAFHFDLDRYLPQLVAGYSRSFASGGLEAFMRDVDKLNKTRIGPPNLSYR